MKEYIDRNALLKTINENPAEAHNERCAQLLEAILNAPTADVVEVVRCKDCKDYESHGNGKYGLCKNYKGKGLRNDTNYCSYGERSENGSKN